MSAAFIGVGTVPKDEKSTIKYHLLIFTGCPLSLRSLCRLVVRRTLMGRERLGMIQTYLNKPKILGLVLHAYLLYQRLAYILLKQHFLRFYMLLLKLNQQ